ncbi:MAG: hypothetical protein Q7U74_06720 [Saprospiraceae bacterium]|nr:hypothetical protein [Saprospiraceae bacterium]
MAAQVWVRKAQGQALPFACPNAFKQRAQQGNGFDLKQQGRTEVQRKPAIKMAGGTRLTTRRLMGASIYLVESVDYFYKTIIFLGSRLPRNKYNHLIVNINI